MLRVRFSCLAVSQALPPAACSPFPPSLHPPKHTQAHFGNITFLEFSFEFNLCLEYIQTKHKENLKAGTLLPFGPCQAPLGRSHRWRTSITSRLKTPSLSRLVSPPPCSLLGVRRRWVMLALGEQFLCYPQSEKLRCWGRRSQVEGPPKQR